MKTKIQTLMKQAAAMPEGSPMRSAIIMQILRLHDPEHFTPITTEIEW